MEGAAIPKSRPDSFGSGRIKNEKFKQTGFKAAADAHSDTGGFSINDLGMVLSDIFATSVDRARFYPQVVHLYLHFSSKEVGS